MKERNTIFLSGGGSGGPVVPLLALVDEWRRRSGGLEYVWIGTKNGPEKPLVQEYGLSFYALPGAKLRRYFSLKNFLDAFNLLFALAKSLYLVYKYKPKAVCSAGGFISVPLAWAAWLLNVPVHIHQQDIRPGLANKLMAPAAKLITATFEKSLSDYPKAVLTGNPVRSFFKSAAALSAPGAKLELGLPEGQKLITVIGGGTGSEYLNTYVEQEGVKLLRYCWIIHISGSAGRVREIGKEKGYQHFDFISGRKMALVLKASDLVISRAGLGLLTELSYLKKPTIIIPMPDSHQEDNAGWIKQNQAAVVIGQKEGDFTKITSRARELLFSENREMTEKFHQLIPKGAAGKIIKEVEKIWR